MTTTIAILTPIIVTHATIVYRYLTLNRHVPKDTTKVVSSEFGIISGLVWISLVTLLAVLMWMKAHNIAFTSFEEFKAAAAIVEALLGGMTHQFVKALYGE